MNFDQIDKTLPFFAYGIFRPGEISFLIIEDLIHKAEKFTINGRIMLRDGLTIFTQSKKSKVNGYLIHFTENKSNEAYKLISNIESNQLYNWEEMVYEITNFNILTGKWPDRGSIEINDFFESIDELHIPEYSIWSDPYLTDCMNDLKFISSKYLNENFNQPDPNWSVFFELQKNYLLLWTIIERFTTLRYGVYNPTQRVALFGKDKFFGDSLKEVTKRQDKIYSTNDLKCYELDKENPVKSIKYYYQVRNNLTHRGKGVWKDFDIVKYSFHELYIIMAEVLKKTKERCDKIKEEYE